MTITAGEADPNAIKYPVSKMKALKAIDGFFIISFLYGNHRMVVKSMEDFLVGHPWNIYAHFPFWSHMFSQIVFLK